MTEQEYKNRRNEIEIESQQKIAVLNKQFAMENNTVKIGDVISNGAITMIVENIIPYKSAYRHVPSRKYSGTILTKKGVAAKKQTGEFIYQDTIIED